MRESRTDVPILSRRAKRSVPASFIIAGTLRFALRDNVTFALLLQQREGVGGKASHPFPFGYACGRYGPSVIDELQGCEVPFVSDWVLMFAVLVLVRGLV